ncbi:cell division protein [Coraliomargarita sinensis]|uniref:Cell division protein n=1 Tax=Coraliomargarita sinensis TaxID=2174842 RepID=A0A317ZCI8_9BACT|nr:SRPBCC family protein [Coraliomargarita sinensis]PXA02846.1 cell division protein [Coraliomargarita sinensis]
MAVIELTTQINAPIERVFDLARSIDAHTASTSQSKERAVAGKTEGLMELDDTVTWEATHFGVKQKLTVRMTILNRPKVFEDEMTKGAFSKMKHTHLFKEKESRTEMSDRFEFEAPLGILGRLAEKMFLTNYMKAFLRKRNEELKQMAESGNWEQFLPQQAEPAGGHNSGGCAPSA